MGRLLKQGKLLRTSLGFYFEVGVTYTLKHVLTLRLKAEHLPWPAQSQSRIVLPEEKTITWSPILAITSHHQRSVGNFLEQREPCLLQSPTDVVHIGLVWRRIIWKQTFRILGNRYDGSGTSPVKNSAMYSHLTWRQEGIWSNLTLRFDCIHSSLLRSLQPAYAVELYWVHTLHNQFRLLRLRSNNYTEEEEETKQFSEPALQLDLLV